MLIVLFVNIWGRNQYIAGSLIYFELATKSDLKILTRKCRIKYVSRGNSNGDGGIHTCTNYIGAALFLEIGLCAEFLIFSARAPGLFCLSKPSPWLILGTGIASIVMSILVRFMKGFGDLTGGDVGRTWLYSIIVFIVADCAKLIFVAAFHITSGVLVELPEDHESHEDEEHLDDEHKELLQGKHGSVHKRPKIAGQNPGGLKGLLTHGNTRDAGMSMYGDDESYSSYVGLSGPEKTKKVARRRSSRASGSY